MSEDTQQGCAICNLVGGTLPQCLTCGMPKQPRGRSAPLGSSYCSMAECTGYLDKPFPDELWPGERYGDSLGHYDWHDKAVEGAPSERGEGE